MTTPTKHHASHQRSPTLTDSEENLDLDFFIENLCQNDFAHKLAESINEINMKKTATMNMSLDSSQLADPLNDTIVKTVANKSDTCLTNAPMDTQPTQASEETSTEVAGANLQLQKEIKAVTSSSEENQANKINELENNLENYFNEV